MVRDWSLRLKLMIGSFDPSGCSWWADYYVKILRVEKSE